MGSLADRGRVLAAVAVFGLATLAAGTARADRKEAAHWFAAGQQATDSGDFLTAIRAFESSFAAEPHPNTLFAMAQAHRQQYLRDRDVAQAKKAIELFQQFVKEEPTSYWRPTAERHLIDLVATLSREPAAPAPAPAAPAPPPPTQLMVTSPTAGARIWLDADPHGEKTPVIRDVPSGAHRVRVEAPGHRAADREVVAIAERLVVQDVELEELPGSLSVSADEPGAQVFLDGAPVGTTPLERGGVSPGAHEIAVARRGRQLWSTRLTVEPDRTALAAATLLPTRQRTVATYTAVGTALVVLAGIVTGVVALSADSALGTAPRTTNAERAAYDAGVRNRNALAMSTDVLFAAGGAGLVTTLGLWWFDEPGAPATSAHAASGGVHAAVP